MTKSITFVALDVHKNSIAVALADAGRNSEVRNYGIIGGSLDDLDRLVKKLVATGSRTSLRAGVIVQVDARPAITGDVHESVPLPLLTIDVIVKDAKIPVRLPLIVQS